MVGVNRFTTKEEAAGELYRHDAGREDVQKGKLKELKASRDNAAVDRALSAIKTAAQGDANLMPPIVDAVRAYATVGEICNVLRDVFGKYRGVVKI